MALDQLELSLMAFPQRWDGPGKALSLNLLLLPVGDPTALLGGGPVFAGTPVPLIIKVASGLDSLPSTATAPAFTMPFIATPLPVAPALYASIRDQLVSKGTTITGTKLTKAPAKVNINKSLPDSYLRKVPFEGSRQDFLK